MVTIFIFDGVTLQTSHTLFEERIASLKYNRPISRLEYKSHRLFDIKMAKAIPFFKPKLFKSRTLGVAHTYSPYRGVPPGFILTATISITTKQLRQFLLCFFDHYVYTKLKVFLEQI